MIASIIVDILNNQVNRTFDYLIPTHLEKIIKIGYRVKVKFGPRVLVGFVVEIKEDSDFSGRLSEIIDVVDVYPAIREEFIEIAKYIKENNFSYYASALQTMLPTALKIKYEKIGKVLNKDLIDNRIAPFIKKDIISIDKLDKDIQKLVYEEIASGNIILDTKFKRNRNEILDKYVYVLDSTISPSSKQGKALLEYLLELNSPVEINNLVEDSGYSKSVINTLIKNKVLGVFEEENIKIEYKNQDEDKKVIFNEQQQKAYDRIDLTSNKTYLLHGITGSGKTEIYLKLIKDCIDSGKKALMLVPEISLTPQITSILVSRFKSDIAILHSGLSVSEKYNMWKKIYDGDIKITVGARSAVFAPIDNLGIIIIDEEHEGSYIQDNNPKYDAKEIAHLRALKHNCPLILGSATPSVVDYHKALANEFELITLNKRANNRPLPKVEVVSLVDELKMGNNSVFSNKLRKEIVENYKKGEQSIVFLNRRGYSTFVMCRSCGEVIKCEHCDISLTYHQNSNTLKCHHCGYTINNVIGCPKCGSSKIRYVGSGTQKIEDDLHNFIPEAKVIRLDHDTTRGKDDYEKAYREFKDKKADILVGTQMITKGLDFENVTLVGIINADLALNYPTYDAYEEAFNVLEQVSGRAGRDKLEGKVIIQTYNPDNPVIKCVKNHDYEGFFNYEIEKRRLTNMPPYSNLYEMMISSIDKSLAMKTAKLIVNTLNKDNKDSVIYGPIEATIFKKNDQFRYIIQIQAKDDYIIEKIKNIYPTYQSNKDITLSITRM